MYPYFFSAYLTQPNKNNSKQIMLKTEIVNLYVIFKI